MTMKQIGLSTITSQKVQFLRTQRERIGTGVGIALSGSQTSQALKSLKQTKLPIETDIAMATLLDSLTNSRVKIDFGDSKNRASLEVTLESEDVYKAARTGFLERMVPLPEEEILARLVRLSALLKPPFGETVKDMKFRMKAVAQNLADVPADITIFAINLVGDNCKIWPSWSEIAEIVNYRKLNRQRLLDSLDYQWLKQQGE